MSERKKTTRILFVCTGNTCRSPMAQAVLRAHRPDLRVLSAGIATRGGKPIAQNAATALHRAGIENTPANPYESHLSGDGRACISLADERDSPAAGNFGPAPIPHCPRNPGKCVRRALLRLGM